MDLEAKVDLRTLNTTGGHKVWPAAFRLLEHLSLHPPPSNFFVELGAGTGWLGLSLALRRSNDVHILLTEQAHEEAQQLLHHNLALNEGLKNVQVAVADFFDLEHVPAPNVPDTSVVIIGSDLVYTREIASAFASFVAAVLRKNAPTYMLYCHTFRRYDFIDSLLLKRLGEEGLKVVEICRDQSEKPVEVIDCETGEFEDFDLFPEQVIRLLKIYFA